MKKIVILGAGTAGTMIVNKLRKAFDKSQMEITIVDEKKTHYYQPGFLFIPFGKYTIEDVKKPKIDFLPKDIHVIFDGINLIDAENNVVLLSNGDVLGYDLLIVASGTKTRPDQTPGLLGKLWYKKIFDFYTVEGALALHEFFKSWEGGHLVISITEIPIKCPVAPIEFVLLADEYFTKKGIRNKVKISFVTPLSGCFTKPIASHMLSKLLKTKDIHVIPDFY